MSTGKSIGEVLQSLLGMGEAAAGAASANPTAATGTAGSQLSQFGPSSGANETPGAAVNALSPMAKWLGSNFGQTGAKVGTALSNASPELIASGLGAIGTGVGAAFSGGGGPTTPPDQTPPTPRPQGPAGTNALKIGTPAQATSPAAATLTSAGTGALGSGDVGASIQDPRIRALLAKILEAQGGA